MLESIRVTNTRGIDTTLGFRNPTDGISISDVQGLGPVVSDISFATNIGGRGSTYSGTAVGNRNIVLTLSLEDIFPAWPVEKIRRRVYGMFPRGETVNLYFAMGEKTYLISGYVESVDPSIFAKVPVMQISIVCLDPDFIELDPSGLALRSLTLPSTGALTDLEYTGTVDTGVIIDITVLPGFSPALPGTLNILSKTKVSITPTLWVDRYFDIVDAYFSGDIPAPRRIAAGDTLRISTIPGKKSAVLSRSGTSYIILSALRIPVSGRLIKESNWPLLRAESLTQFGYNRVAPVDLSYFQVKISWSVRVDGL